MEIDDEKIENLRFRCASEGLGFHKNDKEKVLIRAQKTKKRAQNWPRSPVAKTFNLRHQHKLNTPLSSMDLETFYTPSIPNNIPGPEQEDLKREEWRRCKHGQNKKR